MALYLRVINEYLNKEQNQLNKPEVYNFTKNLGTTSKFKEP
jgi:hypothetical protein